MMVLLLRPTGPSDAPERKDWNVVAATRLASALRVRIELRGFGAFSVRNRAPRTGRNPRTQAYVSVKQKRVPHFKTGKEMRQRLNRTPTT